MNNKRLGSRQASLFSGKSKRLLVRQGYDIILKKNRALPENQAFSAMSKTFDNGKNGKNRYCQSHLIDKSALF